MENKSTCHIHYLNEYKKKISSKIRNPDVILLSERDSEAESWNYETHVYRSVYQSMYLLVYNKWSQNIMVERGKVWTWKQKRKGTHNYIMWSWGLLQAIHFTFLFNKMVINTFISYFFHRIKDQNIEC